MIARTVEATLQRELLPYAVAPQRRPVPRAQVARAIVLTDGTSYLMAVIPADSELNLQALSRIVGRPLEIAAERELGRLFGDCQQGAIPPLGTAYGLTTVIDDSLLDEREIWFAAGDEAELLCVTRDDFLHLLGNVDHHRFCRHEH